MIELLLSLDCGLDNPNARLKRGLLGGELVQLNHPLYACCT